MDVLRYWFLSSHNADSGVGEHAARHRPQDRFAADLFLQSLRPHAFHLQYARRVEKQFVAQLDCSVEFLHRNELKNKYGLEGIPLPVIFRKTDGGLLEFIGSLGY